MPRLWLSDVLPWGANSLPLSSHSGKQTSTPHTHLNIAVFASSPKERNMFQVVRERMEIGYVMDSLRKYTRFRANFVRFRAKFVPTTEARKLGRKQ